MHSSYFRRAFSKLILILAVVAIAGVFLSRGGDNNVSAAGNYDAETTLTLTSSATGASADSQYTFTQGAATMNFSNVATLTAPGACIANERDAINCAGGARPIIGDGVGTLSSATTLGLTNNPCGPSTLPVSFVFLNATTDNSLGNLVNGSNQWEADSGGIQSPFLHDTYTVAPDNDPALPNTTGAAQAG
ncbi:MAG TPA: hypothetical protein VGR43_08405, partial [Dehalococcoidia bacterium]|nr:hypothetical protein [Dehalococcoidia bacterium]